MVIICLNISILLAIYFCKHLNGYFLNSLHSNIGISTYANINTLTIK